MSILNPVRMSAAVPLERTNDDPTDPTKVFLEAGYSADGQSFVVFDAEREDDDNTADRDGNLKVTFSLAPARESGALPEGTLLLAARAIEERPDLATDEFPDGVDLLSAWSTAVEIRVGNPPKAPTGIAAEA